ncbi:zinc-binding dehydrogenase [Amycolatopsis pigmentata]|uniref:Zinc-binding dehydrogenase n=1 Tax=Amycolatopsis pigmentata TaxID=450801 RepID=A0ABW5FSK9_9PSEU
MADAVAYRDKKDALTTLAGLVEDGAVTPVIDRCYPFGEIRTAIGYQEQGHARGKVVVTVRAA